MKIGFVGLGKLGLPCALALDLKGHDVMGYDLNPKVMQKETVPYREQGPHGEPSIEPLLRSSRLRFAHDLGEVVRHSEIIFVAVQTPHEPKYEGVTRLPAERKDFVYTWLVSGMRELAKHIADAGEDKIVVIISTVLPGTLKKYIFPVINRRVKVVYNPFFIAMGTTMRDFLYPEFVLLGVHDAAAAEKVEALYRTVISAPIFRTAIENAELIKVAYNTYISMKIVFANTLMEICHKTPGADVDQIVEALKLATTRIMSAKYLSGGMGDGGGCHPRDNIALSFLARDLNLSYDFFESLMRARENQTEWLGKLVAEEAQRTDRHLPIVILGKSFKPETNITTGSPATLLKNVLEEWGHRVQMYDPYVDGDSPPPIFGASLFVIATKHPDFATFDFAPGSIVVDPWRFIPSKPGVRVVAVGRPPAVDDTTQAADAAREWSGIGAPLASAAERAAS
jgi:UDPglucose 6-dehydrogenase